jgi:hypothetical protein
MNGAAAVFESRIMIGSVDHFAEVFLFVGQAFQPDVLRQEDVCRSGFPA